MNAPLPTGLEHWLPALEVGPDWLQERRCAARARLSAQPLPHSKQEAWRYTSLKGLLEQQFVAVDATLGAFQFEDLNAVLIPSFDAHRVVLVNGRFVPELSAPGGLPAGARLGGLRDWLERDPESLRGWLDATRGDSESFFALFNTAALDDGLVVWLEQGVVLERPIELIHLAVGDEVPRVAQPRHLIHLEAGAQATLVERYVSLDESLYCTNAVTEVALGRGAGLRHERLQMESCNAFHLTGFYLVQDAHSRYEGINVGLGARWARTELNARFRGEQAECILQGLYVAGDGQLLDYHLDVEHAVPHCRSEEVFKGLLTGQGRAVFDGRVLVAKDAQKSDATMSNHNLMLSEQAEIDTKPQLEIQADDVKCSHGTTVGQIEPEMLFYLRSRGIEAVQAQRMLCFGFAGEIIDRLGAEAVRAHVTEAVGRRLT
ncbi:MAG: Fe-S cluster assembly protein SufD [Thermochromatium sp.]